VKVEPITGLITAKSGGTAIIQANSIIEGKTAVSEITVIPDSLTLQAEDAVFDGTVSKDQNGFNGTGFLELASHKTDSITWTVNVNSTSTYSLSFRYALFSGSYKEKLTINGEVRSNTLTFPSTGGFNIWKNIRTKQVLNAGSNTIKLSLIGLVGPRIDELAISNAMDGVAPDSITGATSINFSKTVNTINIYPNPLNAGTLSIDLIGYENMRDVQLKIVNLMGQAVYQKSLNNPTHFEINTTGILEKSVYFITVKSEGFTTFKKLIVN
jgi:hypothetical protein